MDRPLALVVNLGTPERPDADAVRRFLAEFLSDPDVVDYPRWFWQPLLRGVILRRRPARVAELYRMIWTPEGSPLAVETRRVAAALAARLGAAAEVRVAYRYGQPSLAAELERGLAEGEREVVLLPLYAHRTSSATGTILRLAAQQAAASAAPRAPERVRRALLAPDDPGLVEAQAARCEAAFAAAGGRPGHLLVSFHGIPERYDRREKGCYQADCRRTHAALLARLGWDPARATLAYQSRFGPERWLGPATAATLEALPRRGERGVAVVTPGFLTEGLETIEEIGGQGAELFRHAGGEQFVRVPAVSDHPALIEALAARFEQTRAARA
ncbi:MAG: ferrochelatase [Acidobacteria bacterium]|jgi:ferrochelatase|nr:ferrochelatase [Acidobacteriota bacterium]